MARAGEHAIDASTVPVELVLAGLRIERLADFQTVLKLVAEQFDGCGCVVWQVEPHAEGTERLDEAELFAVGQWFREQRSYDFYYIPVQRTATGRAVITQDRYNTRDLRTDPRAYAERRREGVVAMCAVPLSFADGARGALNVYRDHPAALTEREVQRLRQFAPLVAYLYRSLDDHVNVNLVKTTGGVLASGGDRGEKGDTRHPEQRDAAPPLNEVCRLVRSAFEGVDTAVFMQARPVVYDMVGSDTVLDGLSRSFTSGNKGITPYVIRHGSSLKLFDIAHLERAKEALQRRFPGLEPSSSRRMTEAVRRYLKLPGEAQTPPIGFMEAPILVAGQMAGFIRCVSVARQVGCFSDRALDLLSVVAAQVGEYWGRRTATQERRSWLRLLRGLGHLDSLVHDEVERQDPQEAGIFQAALVTLSEIIPGAEILDVRLLNHERDELYYAYVHGEAWRRGTPEEVRDRLKRPFPKAGDSTGAQVMARGQTVALPDVRLDREWAGEFPDTVWSVYVPVGVEGDIFGVLDIRGTASLQFPSDSHCRMAEVVGQQLGLYHLILQGVGQVRRAQDALKSEAQRQAQAFQDLEHQLTSPLFAARSRLRGIVDTNRFEAPLQRQVLAVRGLVNKAERICMNLRLFLRLAEGQELPVKLSRLAADSTRKMVIEAAVDQELFLDPHRGIKIRVERRGFDALDHLRVRADPALLYQALACVLDNAGKYSYPQTTVEVSAAPVDPGRWAIKVANTGIAISPEEVARCTERGFRSPAAQRVTGEGSGIGLWIVHHIMRAHGGDLWILPTTPEGLTRVHLVFPLGHRPE